jgi:hypothetical protein
LFKCLIYSIWKYITLQEKTAEKTDDSFLPAGFYSVKNEDLKVKLKQQSDANDEAEVKLDFVEFCK